MKHIKYDARSLPLDQVTLENICGSDGNISVCYWAPRREEI